MLSYTPGDGPNLASIQDAPRPTAWLLERFDAGLGLVGQFVAAASVVLLGTFTAVLLYQVFDLTRLAIFFLGSVIVCALFFGTRPSIFAAFLAFIAYNFSLVEPRFSLQFAGADDALTLSVFLIVALLVGGLAGRVRESERDSRRRADLLETLLEASRAFSAAADAAVLRDELAAQLQMATDGETFVLPPGTAEDRFDDSVLALVAKAETSGQLVSQGAWRAKSLSRESTLGVAVWRIGETPASHLGAQNRLCGLLVDLAAAALDRIRLVHLQTEVEAGVRAGTLRDAILGSISHDLRTPLATVMASASSLRDYGERFDVETRRSLASDIFHEADRLNSYLESLLALSQIEAGHISPNLCPMAVIEVVDAAISRLGPDAQYRFHTASLDEALEIEADMALLEQAIFNVLHNALVHGGPSIRVEITARRADGRVELVIEDNGSGVPDHEYDQLCKKFYRGELRRPDAPGTGIGLSITEGFVEAMGGSIRLEKSLGSPKGLRVTITLSEKGGAAA